MLCFSPVSVFRSLLLAFLVGFRSKQTALIQQSPECSAQTIKNTCATLSLWHLITRQAWLNSTLAPRKRIEGAIADYYWLRLITVGKRAAQWAQDLVFDLETIEYVRNDLKIRGKSWKSFTKGTAITDFGAL